MRTQIQNSLNRHDVLARRSEFCEATHAIRRREHSDSVVRTRKEVLDELHDGEAERDHSHGQFQPPRPQEPRQPRRRALAVEREVRPHRARHAVRLGQLGHGDPMDWLEPKAVGALAGEKVAEVAAACYRRPRFNRAMMPRFRHP